MTPQQIQEALASFIHPSYPEMEIRVEAWTDDPSRLAIYFRETKFALLYGNGKFTGNVTVDGVVNAKYQDVAEWVPSTE